MTEDANTKVNFVSYDLIAILILGLILWFIPMVLLDYFILSCLILFVAFFMVWRLPWKNRYEPFKLFAGATTLFFTATFLIYCGDLRYITTKNLYHDALSCPAHVVICIGGNGQHSLLRNLFYGPNSRA